MKLLEIIHPAARTLVDISLSQDAEVMSLDVLYSSKACNSTAACEVCQMQMPLARVLTNSLNQCALCLQILSLLPTPFAGLPCFCHADAGW